MGEMLKETAKAKRGPDKDTVQRSQRVTSDIPTLADLGLSKRDSSEAQALAAMPRKTFEAVKSGEKSRKTVKRETKRAKQAVEIKAAQAAPKRAQGKGPWQVRQAVRHWLAPSASPREKVSLGGLGITLRFQSGRRSRDYPGHSEIDRGWPEELSSARESPEPGDGDEPLPSLSGRSQVEIRECRSRSFLPVGRRSLSFSLGKNMKLYTQMQVCVASYFGSPLSGGILMAHNANAVGQEKVAGKYLRITAAATVALMVFAICLPGWNSGNYLTPFAVAWAMGFWYRKVQGDFIGSGRFPEAKRASWWSALGISLLVVIGIFALVFGFLRLFPGIVK